MTSRIVFKWALAVCASAAYANAAFADEAANLDLARTGKGLYAEHCSHCHGFNMVNPGTVTYDLRRFPHDQKERFVNSVIMGKGGIMPPWGDAMNLDEIDALWAYVLTGGHI
jgi:mono/diheme cytochrome c family protein